MCRRFYESTKENNIMILGMLLIATVIGLSAITTSSSAEFCRFGEEIMLNHTTADKSIPSMCMDMDAQSILVNVDSKSEGVLIVDIPRKAVNPVSSCDQDNEFFVLIDGEEKPYEEIKNTETFRRLSIPFASGIQEIEVIDTFVSMMPELLPDCSHKYQNDRITIFPKHQTDLGIKPQHVICEKNLFLMIKNDQTPACVKYDSMFALESRGWGFIPETTKNRHTQWTLEDYKIPVTLDNMELDYIRASYGNQNILMYVTLRDNTNTGWIEFEFPKQAASLIFENDDCMVFTDSLHIEEFILKIDQEYLKTVSGKYADKSQNIVLLSIQIPEHSSVVEVSSQC